MKDFYNNKKKRRQAGRQAQAVRRREREAKA